MGPMSPCQYCFGRSTGKSSTGVIRCYCHGLCGPGGIQNMGRLGQKSGRGFCHGLVLPPTEAKAKELPAAGAPPQDAPRASEGSRLLAPIPDALLRLLRCVRRVASQVPRSEQAGVREWRRFADGCETDAPLSLRVPVRSGRGDRRRRAGAQTAGGHRRFEGDR